MVLPGKDSGNTNVTLLGDKNDFPKAIAFIEDIVGLKVCPLGT